MIKSSSQKIRFIAVGGFNTVVDFGLLMLLETVGFPVLVANTISSGIAFSVSFILNKKITFQTKGTNVRREVILFIVVTLFGLWVIQNIVIAIVQPILPEQILSHQGTILVAKLIATGFSLVWNYVLYSRVVFRHDERE